VRARVDARTQRAEYDHFCREHGLPVRDLVER
jgi:hypothetical protein